MQMLVNFARGLGLHEMPRRHSPDRKEWKIWRGGFELDTWNGNWIIIANDEERAFCYNGADGDFERFAYVSWRLIALSIFED